MSTETHRFATPEPVELHLRNPRGSVELIASDGHETVVHVTSRHDWAQARVDASPDGRKVSVDVPRHRRLGSAPRLDITVHLPAGSSVDLATASASVTTRGPLERTIARTASGTISVEQVTGDADARSASGEIRLGTVGGTTRLRSASGDLSVATAGGPCTAATASGSVAVGWAGLDVTARSASGNLTVRDAVRGTLELHTTSGNVAVGVRKGTLAWLDLTTVSGRASSDLTPDDPATGADEEPVRIRVRTVSGNITIAPSASAGAGGDDRRQPA